MARAFTLKRSLWRLRPSVPNRAPRSKRHKIGQKIGHRSVRRSARAVDEPPSRSRIEAFIAHFEVRYRQAVGGGAGPRRLRARRHPAHHRAAGTTTRRVLTDVIELGLLGSDTPKGRVSLRFPVHALEELFPWLYPAA